MTKYDKLQRYKQFCIIMYMILQKLKLQQLTIFIDWNDLGWVETAVRPTG